MKTTIKFSKLLKAPELKRDPVIVVVNKFNEAAVKEFETDMSRAHNTGQKLIPIVIASF